MHEVADVHRELFAEHADAYGENVRPKIERCLAVTDAEAEAARRLRAEVRERYVEAARDVDLLLTPTVPFVAPPADADESAFRVARDQPHVPLRLHGLACPGAALRAGRGGSPRLAPARRQTGGRRARPGRRGIPRSRDGRPLETADNKGDAPRTPPAGSPRDAGPGQLRQRCPERLGGCSEEPPRFPLPGRRAGPARVRTHAVLRVGPGSRRGELRVRALDEQHVSARTACSTSTASSRAPSRRSRSPCRGSPARRTRSMRASAPCSRTARRRGASRSASTCASRRFRARSRAIPASCAGRRSRARPRTRSG